MKVQSKTYFFLFSLLVSATALIGVAHSEAPGQSYSTSVSIEPSGPGVFLLHAEVTNAAGEVIAGPSLRMPAGETAETTLTFPDATVVLLSATIQEVSQTASYSITIRKKGQILARHDAKIVL